MAYSRFEDAVNCLFINYQNNYYCLKEFGRIQKNTKNNNNNVVVEQSV
jgi:hypothetical protein